MPRGSSPWCPREKHELADDDLPEHGLASSLDNIVFLQHVREGNRLHKVLSVVKMRNAAQDTVAREFFIEPSGFRMASGTPAATLTRMTAPCPRGLNGWLRRLLHGEGGARRASRVRSRSR